MPIISRGKLLDMLQELFEDEVVPSMKYDGDNEYMLDEIAKAKDWVLRQGKQIKTRNTKKTGLIWSKIGI